MKAGRSIIFLFFLWGFVINLTAQSLVATDPLPKNVVLEQFTGIRCGYCPGADVLAQELRDNYPNRVVVIEIHQGSFAEPEGDEPDYRTVWGDSIAELAGVYAYPVGTINRHFFNDEITAMSVNLWTVSTQQIMEETSPVNVGVQSTYDSLTRELTIHVELYYTASSVYHTNYLNIALIQSHIIGPQLGGSADNYEHMYMLRDLITGQWGDTIGPAVEGAFIERDYVYTVPEAVNDIPVIVDDCDVVVFVSETKNEIYTGDVVTAVNGNNRYIGNVSLSDTVMIKKGHAGELTDFFVTTKSALAGDEEFLVTLETKGMPDDWEASFVFGDQSFSDSALITLTQNVEEQLIFQVEPGQTAGFVYFRVKFQSVTYPEAPYRYCKFDVISGVTDLVVNGTGGSAPEQYDYVFTDGLEHAACSTYAVASADDFVMGMHDRALDDIKNIYLNIAWTFPALTIEQLVLVKSFMDNGGNLLISGQDIGWDFMSGEPNSHGSPEATDFYTNYLLTRYISDGTSDDYIILPNESDNVYGQMEGTFLIDLYDGNLYPDNVEALPGADEVYYYETTNKAAITKVATEKYKAVYFACGLEMVGQPDATDQFMKLTYQWFYGLLDAEEFDEDISGLFLGKSKPNPASRLTRIPLHVERKGTFILMNSAGQQVKTFPVDKTEQEIILDVSNLDAGVYYYYILSGNRTAPRQKLVVY